MALGLVPLYFLRWRMNLMLLGDEEAKALGVDARQLRLVFIVAATLMTAAVVAISGTCGHMAGALGVPALVPLDDMTRLYWPAAGDRIAWYPATRFFRRRGRPWQEVFAEIGAALPGLWKNR